MADLIVGYPSNMNTVSAGTAGNVRVTYDPWELDWEVFDETALDGTCFLANTTTAVSSAIIAKGGAEHLGYWFEIAVAFPSANWTSADRITPQIGAAIAQFATIAAAKLAAVIQDRFLLWYASTTNRRIWGEVVGAVANNCYSVIGMLSRMQILLNSNSGVVSFTGNLLAQLSPIVIRNFRGKSSSSGGVTGIAIAPTAGQSPPGGAVVSRCLMATGTGFSFLNTMATSVLVSNCVTWGSFSGFNIASNTVLVHNCTAVRGGAGFTRTGAGFFVNCVAGECNACFSGGGCTTCAATDATIAGAGNLPNQDMRSNLKFFYDLASPGRKKFPCDFRIQEDSVLVGTGTFLAGVPRDADGRLRPNPPSIGAYEPYASAFAPGAELIRGSSRLPAACA